MIIAPIPIITENFIAIALWEYCKTALVKKILKMTNKKLKNNNNNKLDTIAFVHKCIAVSSIKFKNFSTEFEICCAFKAICPMWHKYNFFLIIPCSDSNLCVKGAKIK